MPTDLKDIISNIKHSYENKSSMKLLFDFERVLDSMNLYAFKNWKLGELREGPIIEQYKVKCTFMWPYKLMPDPQGGMRLRKIGAKIKFKRDELVYPIKIKSDNGTASTFPPGPKTGS